MSLNMPPRNDPAPWTLRLDENSSESLPLTWCNCPMALNGMYDRLWGGGEDAWRGILCEGPLTSPLKETQAIAIQEEITSTASDSEAEGDPEAKNANRLQRTQYWSYYYLSNPS
ncbi:hypothetical protein M422DRAFT_255822 [Sphaerobolus stellatus SS14]|uniref:Uncharacterized protein n=1 Tax=Sphaerobolus stellatus (strain SS14) TaxID=990650 RepID=A0A0C9V2U3_SPHS4|nr:hypothetical protein M422DRAFT_261987 [Sphaerobolus stellatus SS14]KIJ41314.1 hypothetical protein M422DRAFT_255822 [Sphaerobolus stellatus SS14]